MKRSNHNKLMIAMLSVIILIGLSLISHKCNAQVSDDWGKYRSGDTVRIQLQAKPYYKYMSKKARITYVTLIDNKQCGLHGLSININPFFSTVHFLIKRIIKI